MHHVNSTTIETQQLRYLDTGPLGNAFTYWLTDMGADGAGPQSMRDVYIGSLMQSRDTKAGPRDQWGNVKIPRIDPLASSTKADSDGWMSIGDNEGVESYSSLLGLPIVGLQDVQAKGDLQFTLETTYIDLSCPSINTVQAKNKSVDTFTLTCPECDVNEEKFRWLRCNKLLGSPFPIDPQLLINRPPLDDPGYSEPHQIIFRSSSVNEGVSIASCTVFQRMVEAAVVCVDRACSVAKIRQSHTDHRTPNITSFDYWATRVLDMITNTNTPPEGTYQSATMGVSSSELFMCDPTSAPVQGLQAGKGDCVDDWGFTNLSSLDLSVYAARASLLLNTGIHTLMAPTAFIGNLPTNNMTLYGPPHIPAEGLHAIANKYSLAKDDAFNLPMSFESLTESNPPFLGAATNATLFRYTEVYQPDYVWVALLAISAALLACLGIAGACLRFFTIVPNIFDPVMGLTFTNPYMPTCSAPGPLDAAERLRAVSNQNVRIGRAEDGGMAMGIAFGEVSQVTPLR
ncbi:hypothetical protein FE257_004526 [Aspergillus nanangensis]|uniref:Uncharacterized protein n=1 Tax=Aspergillus nanangensis TaxID=2582783 RepID=A0AAD4CY65_ASPNN|nr:hypothetical protein FE257_004526 [Aspergillus nanangensis]